MTTTGANLARLFVFGQVIDQIVMMEAPDHADVDSDSNTTEIQRFHYHTQLIGTVTHVTASSQATVESYTYDPYGTPTIKDKNGTTLTASAIKNPYLFTARQLDEETGLYYYRARHYSPGMKRFIQRDPLEYVDGPNAGIAFRSSPSKLRDPFGLKDMAVGGTAAGGKPTPKAVVVGWVASGTFQAYGGLTAHLAIKVSGHLQVNMGGLSLVTNCWIEINFAYGIGFGAGQYFSFPLGGTVPNSVEFAHLPVPTASPLAPNISAQVKAAVAGVEGIPGGAEVSLQFDEDELTFSIGGKPAFGFSLGAFVGPGFTWVIDICKGLGPPPPNPGGGGGSVVTGTRRGGKSCGGGHWEKRGGVRIGTAPSPESPW